MCGAVCESEPLWGCVICVGGDNADDVESGIHISEGEPSPVTLKSPLGQSGLPALFRQRSQSISEEDAPSRGSSVSDETLSALPSKAAAGKGRHFSHFIFLFCLF